MELFSKIPDYIHIINLWSRIVKKNFLVNILFEENYLQIKLISIKVIDIHKNGTNMYVDT